MEARQNGLSLTWINCVGGNIDRFNFPLGLLLGLCLLLLLPFGKIVWAQAVYGSLYGTVTDSSGAAIPNAKIKVTDVVKNTSQVVQSNAGGEYRVEHLIPDTYRVDATAAGFAETNAENIQIFADTSPKIDLHLQVGSASQVITVTGGAPLLQTDRADVSQILNQQAIEQLPNLDRNLTQYELLTPGVQRDTFNIAVTDNPQGTQTTTANGANFGSSGFLLDGTDNREPVLGIIVINPTLDSISEFKATTSNYDAEFGGAVGGIYTAQTRSGSNVWHGDAFEYRHSDAQQARDPFANFAPSPATGRYLPSTLYNQFGGSLGGPVVKDRIFFFLDYQGTSQRVGSSFLETVPTDLVRSTCLASSSTCDLSEYGRGIYNPNPAIADGKPYPNNGAAIPVADLSPQGRNLLALFPAPNVPGAGITNNYAASGNGTSNADQADLRIDYQTNQKLHFFGRYDFALYELFGLPSLGAAGGEGFGLGSSQGYDTGQNQSTALGLDYALSSSLFTDVRFGLLKYHIEERKFDVGSTPATAVGINNLNTGTYDTSGSPTYDVGDGSISNFGSQNCNCPLHESEVVFQLANNWTKTIGRHAFKSGIDLRYALNLRAASDDNRSGQLTFNLTSTEIPGVSNSGLGLATILLGDVSAFERFVLFTQSNWARQKRGAFYGQDSWRVTPKLTWNYGVRWDVVFPETITKGEGGFTDIAAGVVRVPGFGGIAGNGGQKMDYQFFAGRLGFAYQLRSDTVLRGGLSQVYDQEGFFGTLFGSALTDNVPAINIEDYNDTGVGSRPFTLSTLPLPSTQEPIPADGLLPMTNTVNYATIRPPRIQLPEADQYNLTLEQQISKTASLQLAYVGNRSEHTYVGEQFGENINVPRLPSTPAELTDTAARRPYYNHFDQNGVICCDQDLRYASPNATAHYNSLQASLNKRLSYGLQFQGNYTWSKAMNYSDPYFLFDPRLNYSRNSSNRTDVFVLNALYGLPFGKGQLLLAQANRKLEYIVGGWQLSGTTTWESGAPFTPTYNECPQDEDIDTNTTSGTDCRPNGPSNYHLHAQGLDPTSHSVRYFTPVAPFGANGSFSGPFQRPAFGTFGNIGRNAFVGPSEFLSDMSLIKNFPLTERFQGQFQFQAFNVFNHAALSIPSATDAVCVDCGGQSGEITSLDPNVLMRQLQFAVRVRF